MIFLWLGQPQSGPIKETPMHHLLCTATLIYFDMSLDGWHSHSKGKLLRHCPMMMLELCLGCFTCSRDNQLWQLMHFFWYDATWRTAATGGRWSSLPCGGQHIIKRVQISILGRITHIVSDPKEQRGPLNFIFHSKFFAGQCLLIQGQLL